MCHCRGAGGRGDFENFPTLLYWARTQGAFLAERCVSRQRLSDRSQFFRQMFILLLTWQKGRSYCCSPKSNMLPIFLRSTKGEKHALLLYIQENPEGYKIYSLVSK